MNKKIKLLTLLDVLSLYGLDLISPVFAIFVVNKITGGNIKIVGIALAIKLFSENILRLPMARYFDNNKGDRDEYKYLFIGYTFLALLPILYIWIDQVWQIYLLQLLGGIFVAISYPAWYALYSRSVDRGKDSYQWSFNNAVNGLKAASAAFIGGLIANQYGFNYVFLIGPIIGLPGIFALFKIRKYFIK